MTVAKRIARDHPVGGNQGIIADALDEAEQRRAIDHLDFPQLFSGKIKNVCRMPDVEVVDQLLVGGEEFG